MYEYIEGTLADSTPVYTVIDVNGVGYKLVTPVTLLGSLPPVGQKVRLYTSWIVRELSQTLYGFLERDERNLFEVVITLSGIGPKTGLALIGHLSLSAMQEAVNAQNVSAFSKVPGIGKKTAERLLVDLRDKLPNIAVQPMTKRGGAFDDALSALINLGYSQKDAQAALEKVQDESTQEWGLARLLREALKARV